MAARRVPIIRIGLTVIVGSILVSLVAFYVSLGESFAGSLDPGQSAKPRDVLTHFTKDFLFVGTLPTGIFWLGALITVVGIARNFFGREKPE